MIYNDLVTLAYIAKVSFYDICCLLKCHNCGVKLTKIGPEMSEK